MTLYTIKESVVFEGIGVHTGHTCRITLAAAPKGHGIRFYNALNESVSAHTDAVGQTQFCTALRWPSGDSLMTVEHLMAALFSLHLTDLAIHVVGPEIPVMDGSSQVFCQTLFPLRRAISGDETVWTVKKAITLHHENSWITLRPHATHLRIAAEAYVSSDLSYSYTYKHSTQSFMQDIAAARTTSTLTVVKKLQSMGLAKGGSLANALVLDDQGHPINAEGVRFSCEWARHKILDLLGDLALCGLPLLCAEISTYGPGHTLSHKLRCHLHKEDLWTSLPTPHVNAALPYHTAYANAFDTASTVACA